MFDKKPDFENTLGARVERILRLVQNPQRYVDGEIGSIRKEHDGRLKVALAFPEPYELAMSHSGYRILYHIINKADNLLAERVFCPGMDMVGLMRERDIPLFTLETKSAVADFDLFAFSLQTELSYSNVLMMMDLAKIPLLRSERGDDYPITIAGGPSAFNPEPLADIFDVFFIGDAEANLIELLEIIHANKALSKRDKLLKIKDIDGVYLPEFYAPVFDGEKQTGFDHPDNMPYPVKKSIAPELLNDFYPDQPIIPWMELIHDRYGLEIMRGCSRGCRFCLAGFVYRPVRERRTADVVNEAHSAIGCTGMEELGLLSLSTTDYSGFLEVMSNLRVFSQSEHLSLSVPSIRPEAFGDELFSALATERKGGLTLAPEAATPRLRAVINKFVDMDELEKTIKFATEKGWKRVKLYFMIGLPTETDDDIIAIIDVAKRFDDILRRVSGRLKVSISPFVPKAHTPFQWVAQDSCEEIQRKHDLIYDTLKSRKMRIGLDTRNTFTPFLEGIFARGDRRLGKILMEAYRNGASFDAWDDIRNEEAWHKAFEQADEQPESYLRERNLDEFLPWQIIHTGVKPEMLKREYDRAFVLKYTKDCREIRCESCNQCDFDRMVLSNSQGATIHSASGNSSGFGRTAKRSARRNTFSAWNFVRIKYARFGELRFLSHLDMGRILRRAIRRAKLPVAFTQGFHKHEKIAFGPPLAVGHSSLAEFVDIHFANPVTEDSFLNFFRQFPPGIEILGQKYLNAANTVKSLTAFVDRAVYAIIPDDALLQLIPLDKIEEGLNSIVSMSSLEITRRSKTVDIRKYLHGFKIYDDMLVMVLELSNSGSGRVEEYLEAIGIPQEIALGLQIIRTDVFNSRMGQCPFGNTVNPLTSIPDISLIERR